MDRLNRVYSLFVTVIFIMVKPLTSSERIENITQRLNVSKTIVMPLLECIKEDAPLSNIITLDEFIGDITAQPLVYTRVAFSDPLYIMFSSGTTGVPKCIVHSVGGTLLQHSKGASFALWLVLAIASFILRPVAVDVELAGDCTSL